MPDVTFRWLGSEPQPPLPLIGGGIVHPIGTTIIYGSGGIGKGWIACWIMRELVREGRKPCVLDFEGFPYEWEQRLYGMGIRTGEIGYIEPGGALTELRASVIADTLRDNGLDYVVVDSASAARKASSDGDAGGADAALSLFRAIQSMRFPATMLAHVGKRNEDSPIGSVQYVNQARLVYHASQSADAKVSLEMTKVNDRIRAFVPITFTWADGDFVRVVNASSTKAEAAQETLSLAIIRILAFEERSMDRHQMQSALAEEGKEVDLVKVGNLMRFLFMSGKITRTDRGRYAALIDTSTIHIVE